MTNRLIDTKKKCKHDFGWCLRGYTYLYVGDKNYYKGMNFVEFGARGNKLVFICNKTTLGCRAIRNIYLKGKVLKWGRINYV